MKVSHSKFLIYGMYGAINVGDEIIALAMADNLASTFPGSTVNIASMDPVATAQFIGDHRFGIDQAFTFGAKSLPDVINTITKVRDYDVLIVGGGGLFQDQYSFHLPAGALLMCALGLAYGKSTFVVGVGVGPIESNWLKRKMARIFPFLCGVYVRDNESLQETINLVHNTKCVRMTADIVPSLQKYDRYRNDWNPESRIISFILRDWPGLKIDDVARAVETIIKRGYEVHFHCYEYSSDFHLAESIIRACHKKIHESITVLHIQNAEEAIRGIVESRLVVSMRLHGCVLAASQGVPWIPVYYERKIKGFAEQMGMEQRLLYVSNINHKLFESIKLCILYYERRRGELIERFDSIRSESLKNFTFIAEQLESCNGTNKISQKIGKREVLLLFFRGYTSQLIHMTKRGFCIWKRNSLK